jgi:phospholipase/lecithinase/hemolysin
MRTSIFRRWFALSALTAALLIPTGSSAIEFNSIVVFGGSISDPGNFFALFHISNSPPYNFDELPTTLVPTGPYSKGGHHFSNGSTWIEELGKTLGLNRYVQGAFRGSSPHATNYAVGGARSTDVKVPFDTFDMPEQIGAFLAEHAGAASSDALYVIDFGGNDVRDALLRLALDDMPGANQILTDAIVSIVTHVTELQRAGARKFLFVNVADIGSLPSIRILANALQLDPLAVAAIARDLTERFNAALIVNLINPLKAVAEVAVLDVFATVDELINEKGDFGLTNVADPCITPNVPPFSCKKPDQYLFWDGVHPTKAVHEIFADVAFEVLNPVVAKK